MKAMRRIPIKAVKELCRKLGYDQMIIVAFDRKGGSTSVATYGRTMEDCAQAAAGGNLIKKAIGWPAEYCAAEPARIRRLKELVKKARTD